MNEAPATESLVGLSGLASTVGRLPQVTHVWQLAGQPRSWPYSPS